MTKKSNITVNPLGAVNAVALLADLRGLIQAACQRVATVANSTHTMLCWTVGQRLLKENLQDGRGAYGKQILATLSQELSWSNFQALLPIKDPLARDFYAERCRMSFSRYPTYKGIGMEWLGYASLRGNKTRQGYARKRILKLAGYFFVGRLT